MNIHNLLGALEQINLTVNRGIGNKGLLGRRIHWASTVPSGVAGYAKGCLLVDIDDGVLYINTGTRSSCTFTSAAAALSIADAGGYTSNTTVETALQELLLNYYSATGGCISLSIYEARIVDSATDPDVGNIAANGGSLASDTAPILRGNASGTPANDAFTQELFYNHTGDVVIPIAWNFAVPKDFDGASDVTVEFMVASGATNAATLTIVTGWDGGAPVTDTASDSATKSVAFHTISATIAAADIPDAPTICTLTMAPASHSTDDVLILGGRLLYKRKIRTS